MSDRSCIFDQLVLFLPVVGTFPAGYPYLGASKIRSSGWDGESECMITIRLAWIFIAFFAWCAGIAHAGEIRTEAFPSNALGRDMQYVVYLPDGYQNGRSRYPVLYLLHGAGGDERSWLDRGQIKDKADRLIARGAMPPAIIVMPGCPACWWVDGAKDKAEAAFWSDLVPKIDRSYRTIEARGGRVIAGLSAGGYGAVRYALRYPDRIAAAAALSPAVYSQPVPPASAARRQPPFLAPDGRFDQAAWDAQNYPGLLDRYFAQSYRVPLYLVSGDADKLGLAFETSLLFKRMSERQEQLELRIVGGDHSWKVWEATIDQAMQYIFQFTDRPKPAPLTATATKGLEAAPVSANP
jgi:enterochelin esterase-like enzyme